jgi:hypothetical protein
MTRSSFNEQRRQAFLTLPYYEAKLKNFADVGASLEAKLVAQSGDLDDRRSWSYYLSEDAYRMLSLRYTAGESIESLRVELEQAINACERYQKIRTAFEQIPEIAPLGLSNIGDFERCMQLIGLCYLLHRRDLLPRIATLQDATYAGGDALYEDLMRYGLANRPATDEMLHMDVYDPLLGAIWAQSDDEAATLLNQYVTAWYLHFKYVPWHDGHLRIDGVDGDYFGYWAFEAGAVAYLCDVDDTAIDHQVYPKDLMAWARANKHLAGTP